MAKIFLDPGHGGIDSGAVGNGLYEKDITLAVALKVKADLERNNQTVIMSRTTDVNPSLTERSNMANSNNCDASISIHCNAAGESARGVETYTYAKGQYELALANGVHGQIIEAGLYSVNRGIKQENFHMVRETKMAAILVELAFITNSGDAKLLTNYQEEFAVAITKGILQYLGVSYTAARPYGTRDVYVNGNIVCTSDKTSEILEAVEKGLATTAKIEIIM